MYVSVTALKTTGIKAWIKFWILTIPAFRAAQKAPGNLFCQTKKRHGYRHTLTVWEKKKDMLSYRMSPSHLKAMQQFNHVGIGQVYGYESDKIPSWEEALQEWDKHFKTI